MINHGAPQWVFLGVAFCALISIPTEMLTVAQRETGTV